MSLVLFKLPIRPRLSLRTFVGNVKTGKPRYWFSTKAEGDLVDAMPEGHEIYENPDAQVFLRKIVPQLVTRLVSW